MYICLACRDASNNPCTCGQWARCTICTRWCALDDMVYGNRCYTCAYAECYRCIECDRITDPDKFGDYNHTCHECVPPTIIGDDNEFNDEIPF